jgi:hypothetical protein
MIVIYLIGVTQQIIFSDVLCGGTYFSHTLMLLSKEGYLKYVISPKLKQKLWNEGFLIGLT